LPAHFPEVVDVIGASFGTARRRIARPEGDFP